MTTDPETPTVPEGWIAVPVSEVEALRDAVVQWSGGDSEVPVMEAADPIVARLPKPPAWTDEDRRLVADAIVNSPLNLAWSEAGAVLTALAEAGRLRDPEEA